MRLIKSLIRHLKGYIDNSLASIKLFGFIFVFVFFSKLNKK